MTVLAQIRLAICSGGGDGTRRNMTECTRKSIGRPLTFRFVAHVLWPFAATPFGLPNMLWCFRVECKDRVKVGPGNRGGKFIFIACRRGHL
jgi:hypothetical protein